MPGFGGREPGSGDNWTPQIKNEQEQSVVPLGIPFLVLAFLCLLIGLVINTK